jgi:predicted RNA binding protein YcfA (HicA-like mRNA interferase family)
LRAIHVTIAVGIVLTMAKSVGIIPTMNSRDLVRVLKDAGWYEDRVAGSHHIFKHATKPGHLSVPHPKKDLGTGLVEKILKRAGLK